MGLAQGHGSLFPYFAVPQPFVGRQAPLTGRICFSPTQGRRKPGTFSNMRRKDLRPSVGAKENKTPEEHGGSAMVLEISDDSGLIALMDAETYNAFIDPDWELEQLTNRFKEEIQKKHLLIWGTAPGGGLWNLEIRFGLTAESGFRTVEGVITCSKKELYLVSYESLTMAAQFDDITLPEDHLKDLRIQLETGTYKCRIIQMFDPTVLTSDSSTISFIIEFDKAQGNEPLWTEIPWFKL